MASNMTTVEALQVLIDQRRDKQIVITNQGSSREWPKLAEHPLDFHFLPSAMGAAIPLGLGLALAKPDYEVIVISGDGSLLMNMGTLATVTASSASNLSIILLDNGVYAVTGCQRNAGSSGNVDYAGLARATGFENVSHFTDESSWRNGLSDLLTSAGPRFVWLNVTAEHHTLPLGKLAPIEQRLTEFQSALGDS